MDVVLLLMVLAILVGVFFVAIGRGSELALEPADHAPLDLGAVSGADVALLRPPTAMWGYNVQVTDEALDVIARALRDRDIEIAYLRRQLEDLGHGGPALDAAEDAAAGPWSRMWAPPAAEPAQEQAQAQAQAQEKEQTHAAETSEMPAADDTAVTPADEQDAEEQDAEEQHAEEQDAEEQGW